MIHFNNIYLEKVQDEHCLGYCSTQQTFHYDREDLYTRIYYYLLILPVQQIV